MIYIITRTRLDLCNFYGPSVRISARYKTPNPLCSSSLLLPSIFSRSLCFFSPKISLLRLAHSLITSLASPIFRRLPNQTLITGCAQTLIYSQFYSFYLTVHSISLITPAATPRYSFIIFSYALLAISSLFTCLCRLFRAPCAERYRRRCRWCWQISISEGAAPLLPSS